MSTYSIVIGPYFASGYITDDYVLDGTFVAAATTTVSGDTFTLKDAEATLASVFTLDQNSGFLIQVNEIIAYTWQEVDGNWQNWPGSQWEYDGVRLQASCTLALPTLNTIFQGAAALSSESTMAVTGTHMRFGSADLSSVAEMATQAELTHSGQASVTSEFNLVTQGLRIQEIETTLFDGVTLTTTASVTWSGVVDMTSAVSTQITSRVTWNGDPETFAAVATLAAASGVVIRNQDQTFALPATTTLQLAITLAKTDPYRALVIDPQSRELTVYSQPREASIAVNTRIAQVMAQSRALEIEQANRVLKLNIPPFKQIVNERQI